MVYFVNAMMIIQHISLQCLVCSREERGGLLLGSLYDLFHTVYDLFMLLTAFVIIGTRMEIISCLYIKMLV